MCIESNERQQHFAFADTESYANMNNSFDQRQGRSKFYIESLLSELQALQAQNAHLKSIVNNKLDISEEEKRKIQEGCRSVSLPPDGHTKDLDFKPVETLVGQKRAKTRRGRRAANHRAGQSDCARGRKVDFDKASSSLRATIEDPQKASTLKKALDAGTDENTGKDNCKTDVPQTVLVANNKQAHEKSNCVVSSVGACIPTAALFFGDSRPPLVLSDGSSASSEDSEILSNNRLMEYAFYY